MAEDGGSAESGRVRSGATALRLAVVGGADDLAAFFRERDKKGEI